MIGRRQECERLYVRKMYSPALAIGVLGIICPCVMECEPQCEPSDGRIDGCLKCKEYRSIRFVLRHKQKPIVI